MAVAEQLPAFEIPERMRRSVLAVLLLTVLLATTAVFFGSLQYLGAIGQSEATNRLSLYQRSLNESLQQHQHLPYILAQEALVLESLSVKDPDAVNERLRDYAREAKLEAIYIMNRNGLVLASSNAGEANSFIGQNYGFRPYFQQALEGERSDYFAIGATSGRPGYFVAEPVRDEGGAVQGVIAIKLDISELQKAWQSGTDTVIAVNGDNVVVLASNPSWLYRSIVPIEADRLTEVLRSRQFGSEPLAPLDWTATAGNKVTFEGRDYLAASGSADWRGWKVYFLVSEATVYRQTAIATGFFGTIVALLIGFATYLRSRRIKAALQASLEHRQRLITTNAQLNETQAELARTTKLAALGQLAASVTHELGQPISALRNHLTAAEIGNEITSPETASNLNKLVDRMDSVTRQLRFFARDENSPKSRVQVAQILRESFLLISHDLDEANILFDQPDVNPDLLIEGHQIELEQALVNLLRNAIHAVQSVDEPKISVSIQLKDQTMEISVSDNGAGLQGVSLSELQEPFFSTKPSGMGMGLGLSITTEIIKAHGGTLRIEDASPNGAVFIMSLPLMDG